MEQCQEIIKFHTNKCTQFYNIIVILIKLGEFVGFDCNNSFLMHGMDNVKLLMLNGQINSTISGLKHLGFGG